MSDNWVVQNLQNALGTWNDKLAEVWQLMTMSPENFKGGGIWNVILNINGAMQAIGLALLVLFFLAGVVQTSANLTDVKRPEHALKLFLRFAIAKGVVTYGLELMMAVFEIVQGIISKIMRTSGLGGASKTSLPAVVDADAAPIAMVWKYIGELVFNMLVLVGSVKMSDRIIREMMGL